LHNVSSCVLLSLVSYIRHMSHWDVELPAGDNSAVGMDLWKMECHRRTDRDYQFVIYSGKEL